MADGREEVGGLEPGGDDDRVDHPPAAVCGDHGVGFDAGDRLGDDCDVVAAQRIEIVVGDQDAFAPHRIVRQQFGAQVRILDAFGDERRAQIPGDLGGLRSAPERDPFGFETGVQPRPIEQIPAGNPLETALLGGGELGVGFGEKPVRGPLELVENLRLLRHRRDELHGAGAVADHRDPFVGQVVVVVPACRMEDRSREVGQTFDVGPARPIELAQTPDDHVEGVGATRAGRQLPAGGVFVPAGVGDLGCQMDVIRQVVLGDAVAEVVEDLGLFGEAAGPVGPPFEGVRIQVGGDVTPGIGVGVVPPHAPDVVGLVEDLEIVVAVGGELDRHADPPDAGADDADGHRSGGRSRAVTEQSVGQCPARRCGRSYHYATRLPLGPKPSVHLDSRCLVNRPSTSGLVTARRVLGFPIGTRGPVDRTYP